MKGFAKEFKEFAMKGNVMDLAVAVVIGGAFGKIVTSLVNNIIMPLVGLLLGGVDFTTYMVEVGEVQVTYGVFVQSVIDFVIIALAIFVVVKMINNMQRKEEEAPAKPKEPSEEVKLLTEIRDSLKRQ